MTNKRIWIKGKEEIFDFYNKLENSLLFYINASLIYVKIDRKIHVQLYYKINKITNKINNKISEGLHK